MLGKDEIQRGEGKLNTIIGKGSTFVGNLEVAGGLRVDGKIEGSVKAESVFMGKEAEIIGDVAAHTAILGGKTFGNVTATFIELQSKAELYGDVSTKTLIVAEGVVLQGKCDMGLGDRSRKTATPVKADASSPEEAIAPPELTTEEKLPFEEPAAVKPELKHRDDRKDIRKKK